ncbi:MAG: Rrf2 family transcriptional regulator [Planctomycetes bacterium]|nr:Rrf2 family transcriptional regulator [Planctomycetota bacterium]
MRISKKCQYALRAVFELSLRNSGHPVKISEIAKAQGISGRFLEIILNQLRHAGFVESRRGSEGGYLLVKSAETLTVGDVIEVVQGPVSVIGNEDNHLDFFGSFAFEQLWQEVNDTVSQIYRNTTFAELIKKEKARKRASVPNYTI